MRLVRTEYSVPPAQFGTTEIVGAGDIGPQFESYIPNSTASQDALRPSSVPKHSSGKLYRDLEGGRECRRPRWRGFWRGNLHVKPHDRNRCSPRHEPLPFSKPARAGRWQFMEKWFCAGECVAARNARRCSGFARTAIVDSAIAVRGVARKNGFDDTARQTAVTKGVPKVAMTTGTGNRRTGNATRPLA